jgi:hypothetical protein
MKTSAKLPAFALGLTAVFGAALGVGNAVGPVGPAAPPAVDSPDSGRPDPDEPTHEGMNQ